MREHEDDRDRRPRVQASSTTSRAGDAAEVEAERTARAATSGRAERGASRGARSARPRPQGGGSPVGEDVARGITRSRGQGLPLDPRLRGELEPHVGIGLDHVRVHTGDEAARLTWDLGARAFTSGSDIWFGRGQYRPDTHQGRHLIAHETAHVAQQAAGPATAVQRDPMTDEQRRSAYDRIANRISIVHSDFDNGAQTAEEDVRNEAAADANIAKAFFGIAMAVVIPGFGPVAGSILGRFGVTVTSEVANVIGGAIGEAAKSAGSEAIDRSYSRDPRAFFTAVTRGFEAGLRRHHDWISDHKLDRAGLPDSVMNRLVSYYDTLADAEGADWARMLKSLWDRFNAQVVPVGRTSTAMTGYGPTPHLKNMVARVAVSGGQHRFALVQRVRTNYAGLLAQLLGQDDIRTYYRFLRWIDDDLSDAAQMRAGHVLVLPPGEIRELPD